MNKSSELVVTASGIVAEETGSGYGVDGGGGGSKAESPHSCEPSRSSPARNDSLGNIPGAEALKTGHENEDKVPKFAMIFNKYNTKLNLRANSKYQDNNKSKDKIGSKYTMIFNKDVTIRAKTEASQSSLSKTDLRKGEDTIKVRSAVTIENPLKAIEPELSSLKLNDAETLMTLYGRSNLFIPELTICSLSESEDKGRKPESAKQGKTPLDNKRKANDSSLRLYNSLTSLSKSKTANRRSDNLLKNKIASLTSLETHLAREVPRKHVSVMQERKLFRVRSLDLSESVSSSDSDLERSLNFQKTNSSVDDSHSPRMKRDTMSETLRKSDKKSRGDTIRKGDKENGCRKQVQWKSEVDVIYFESHQAADGDRSGEILGRVMEPLREEWEQQRTGFYAKMVPLPLGSHLSERWQSLLKI